eukprot:12398642-Karenia_brevis.AAC.1
MAASFRTGQHSNKLAVAAPFSDGSRVAAPSEKGPYQNTGGSCPLQEREGILKTSTVAATL